MMRGAILGVGALATVMGITITTIYGLWFLCADLVYVILFPQLVSVLYLKHSNTYGSLAGYLMGLFFRLLGGEPLVHLPATIIYPWYDEANKLQMFPYKTLTMLISFSTIVVCSYVTKYIFEEGHLPKNWDIFRCVVNIPEEVIALREPAEESNGEMASLSIKKAPGNGQINPALKLTKEDLLNVDKEEMSRLSSSPEPDRGSDDDINPPPLPERNAPPPVPQRKDSHGKPGDLEKGHPPLAAKNTTGL